VLAHENNLTARTGDIIYMAWYEMKMWSPCLKMMNNFNMVTAEH
jgi:hypothetical protein